MIRTRIEKPLALVFLVIMAVITVFPIAWLILTGFMPPLAVAASTPQFVFTPTLDNYVAILQNGTDSPVIHALINSIGIALVTTLVSMVLATMAAYGIARLRPRGHQLFRFVVLGFKVLPPVAMIVPLFLIASGIHLVDTQLALILPYIALSMPFATWLMFGFFEDLPHELEEAALVDGATWFGAFRRVVLPLAAPGLAATSVFTFGLSWNDLALSLALTRSNAVTLPVLAAQVRTDQGILWGQLGAMASLMILPMLIFTILTSKYLVQGLSSGAVK